MGRNQQGPRASDLDQRINQSGLIQPGAKPQYDRPTPLDRVGDFFNAVGRRLNTTGNRRSPSTQMDRRGPMVRSDADVEAAYQRDKAARRGGG